MQPITPFFMFEGNAEEAMNFYLSIFEGASISHITRYGANEAGKEGSVQQAIFTLNGQTFMCIDSPIKHDFTFTPALSLYITCDTEEEIDRLYGALSIGGAVLMPINAYPFSQKFAWFNDRFGVSWQLNLL
ncbi:VOC family protein [Domibacillus sp. A3M-37]|uniref:VOC family protein n=1 Tax=Domibacillus sp. A3M-37 TaxID=2962037 RepID=UPI0020B8294D|nr:VOC family protein [Domibacillus sp. A3M-37]MCP3761692.1 VOC family protein [Domibacillus sp. A3M-37]